MIGDGERHGEVSGGRALGSAAFMLLLLLFLTHTHTHTHTYTHIHTIVGLQGEEMEDAQQAEGWGQLSSIRVRLSADMEMPA